ncbi:cell division control protein 14 [Dissophora ornata]|nr:cell division control protein 14 [Dissophora ornata]
MSPSMTMNADELADESALASTLSTSTLTLTPTLSSDANTTTASSTASSFVVAGRKHQSTPPPTPFATRSRRQLEPSVSVVSSAVAAALVSGIDFQKNGTTRSHAIELGKVTEYEQPEKQKEHEGSREPDGARGENSTYTNTSSSADGLRNIDCKAYNVREFIPGHLYFMCTTKKPIGNNKTTYLTVDGYLEYSSFFSDFGPFDIASIFRFISLIKERLEIATSRRKALCLYTEPEDGKRANVAFAMCCYMMLIRNKTPEDAYAPIKHLHPPVKPFRDAGSGPSTYTLSILDCLRGLRKGLDLGLLRLEDFDLNEYEHYELRSNGDLNWITPSFVAFAGPVDRMTHAKLVGLKKKEIMREQEQVKDKAEEEEKAGRAEGAKGADLQLAPNSMSENEDDSGSQSSSGLSTVSSSSEAPTYPSTPTSLLQPFARPSDTGPTDRQQKDNKDAEHLLKNADEDTDYTDYTDYTKPRTRLLKPFQSVLDYFETHRIQCVIRLNDKMYDETHFRVRGIEHFDLIYPDGHCPPPGIINRFLEISERVIMGVKRQGKERISDEKSEREGQRPLSGEEKEDEGRGGVVAVHCMAGLGRTGTLIAVYLMRHFDMTARETIAFLRLMRPGMVVGPQQNWLALNERQIRQGGQQWRRRLQQRKQQLHSVALQNRLTTDSDHDEEDVDVEDSDDVSSMSMTTTDDSGDENTGTEGSLSGVSYSTSRSTTPGSSELDMGATTDIEDNIDDSDGDSDSDIEAPILAMKEVGDDDEDMREVKAVHRDMEGGLATGMQPDKERVGGMDYVIPIQPRKQVHRSYAQCPRSC